MSAAVLSHQGGDVGKPDVRVLFSWWTRTQRIRTAARIPFETSLVDASATPTYVRIATKALRLRELGLSDSAIAKKLDVSDKTVAKAIAWLERIQRVPDR